MCLFADWSRTAAVQLFVGTKRRWQRELGTCKMFMKIRYFTVYTKLRLIYKDLLKVKK